MIGTIGARATAQHLRTRFGLPRGTTEQHAADLLWALTAPELAGRLITTRGWTWRRYQSWLGTSFVSALVTSRPA